MFERVLARQRGYHLLHRQRVRLADTLVAQGVMDLQWRALLVVIDRLVRRLYVESLVHVLST